jgi:hypothetical protein
MGPTGFNLYSPPPAGGSTGAHALVAGGVARAVEALVAAPRARQHRLLLLSRGGGRSDPLG